MKNLLKFQFTVSSETRTAYGRPRSSGGVADEFQSGMSQSKSEHSVNSRYITSAALKQRNQRSQVKCSLGIDYNISVFEQWIITARYQRVLQHCKISKIFHRTSQIIMILKTLSSKIYQDNKYCKKNVQIFGDDTPSYARGTQSSRTKQLLEGQELLSPTGSNGKVFREMLENSFLIFRQWSCR